MHLCQNLAACSSPKTLLLPVLVQNTVELMTARHRQGAGRGTAMLDKSCLSRRDCPEHIYGRHVDANVACSANKEYSTKGAD